jgi:hypothetical protein
MSNLTSGSALEYFPIIGQAIKPNKLFRQSIIGHGNQVASTAQDIIVNGFGNSIGDDCRSINILNTSGSSVTSGVIGVNLFSCSGLIIDESDVIYIKNVKITESSFGITSGVTFSQSLIYTGAVGSYDMTTDNFTVVATQQPLQLGLPPAVGQTQVYNIKNQTGADLTFYGDLLSGTDTIEGETSATIGDGASLTLQSNGSTNYIII